MKEINQSPYYLQAALSNSNPWRVDWRQSPHVAFANMQLTPASIINFARRYGLLYVDCRGPLKESAEPTPIVFEENLSEAPAGRMYYLLNRSTVEKMQSLLRSAWSGDKENALLIANGDPAQPDDRVSGLPQVEWSGRTAQTLGLWHFIRLAFGQDYFADRARVCPNPDCTTPYFVQVNKKQMYCSRKCAVAASVARFRERERKGR